AGGERLRPRGAVERPRHRRRGEPALAGCHQLVDGGLEVRFEQSMSQLEEIRQVSTNDVDEHGERKREAAHGLDRVTAFSGRKRHMSSPILPIEGDSSLSSTL